MGLTLSGFTDRARAVVEGACQAATTREQPTVNSAHLLLALARADRGLGRVTLEQFGVFLENEMEEIERLIATSCANAVQQEKTLGRELRTILKNAKAQSRTLYQRWLGSEHLILALLAIESPVAAFLKNRTITEREFRAEMLRLLTGEPHAESVKTQSHPKQ